ncbi:hypothetical protein CLV24_10479 [Pontibacter ummariensis]|uniref:DUF3108 domain-containing protein n=1 Tax=Pontibacter ummariensis TaxID=1610492 RepID=A0A239D739_9BACT|nr:hypothetical protein [Pontibacter ummariensis]PRY14269.1 hypothetical protein CLV24_10479 [Pontibacter ummariensis]SNS27828.1 hypothetical protein SAMN06296052_10478 [Pontibacter ummariensis]
MKKLLLAVCSSLLFTFAVAQPDTVHVSANTLRMKQLKPGLRQYVVTIQRPDKPGVLNQSLWNRDVRFENYKGRERLVIRQNWVGTDSTVNRKIFSICEKNFSPIYHTSTSFRGTAAFEFQQGQVVGSDTTRNNAFKGFQVPSPEQAFNWELDLEFFEALPLKANTVYSINFYHPGSKPGPSEKLYQVVGSEKIPTSSSTQTDCWKLRIDYDKGNYAMFWISKKEHEVLKMEESFNGVIRHKVKLSTTAGNYI